MASQNHEALKEAAIKMKNDQDSDIHGAFEDIFFASKEFDDRLQEKRQALIQDVDTYITDSQRPGSIDANLSGKSCYYQQGKDISTELMRWRRDSVENNSELAASDVYEILSLNFIFFDLLLSPLQKVRLEEHQQVLSAEETVFIGEIALQCSKSDFEDAEIALHSQSSMSLRRSRTYATVVNMMATNVLWKTPPFFEDNEDTFTDRYIRPWIMAFFGNLPGATLRWNRDKLCTGALDAQEPLYPDTMLCTTKKPAQTLLVCEIKKLDTPREALDEDRVKLFTEMKRCLDGLLFAGVDGKVVGILGQGYRVEVWMLELPYEAI
ncbi:hypothetical protein BGX26_003243 [Mortierella sp. AD094]|nr:hypothetical protein BGX26_003243 [Mortierella sp. AD094]